MDPQTYYFWKNTLKSLSHFSALSDVVTREQPLPPFFWDAPMTPALMAKSISVFVLGVMNPDFSANFLQQLCAINQEYQFET